MFKQQSFVTNKVQSAIFTWASSIFPKKKLIMQAYSLLSVAHRNQAGAGCPKNPNTS